MKSLFASLLLSFALLSGVHAQKFVYPPEIEGASVRVYKNVSDMDLKLWAFNPDGWKADDSRPAIVFFFGGGWRSGSPMQFVAQSKYLAERGMVAIVADYRVASRNGTQAKDCVADARDAMRFVRKNASKLGIDPNRLAAGGGSAGGHLAACLGVIEEDAESKPNLMVLFNPACVLAPVEGKDFGMKDRSAEMKERMGVDPKELSPVHHVSAKAPPCIVFHGKKDTTVLYSTAVLFSEMMNEAGATCQLKGYAGKGARILQ